ncbi:hypothetical protein [Hymenobacter rubripertinctus]|uniref:hypothetical protein n=1 Tax=Hymenobacter rubripertinctus TaxID=2029981 RepID=UPI0016019147|nr:hypothetical protein [Hymenobacter rubripertinctus]
MPAARGGALSTCLGLVTQCQKRVAFLAGLLRTDGGDDERPLRPPRGAHRPRS